MRVARASIFSTTGASELLATAREIRQGIEQTGALRGGIDAAELDLILREIKGSIEKTERARHLGYDDGNVLIDELRALERAIRDLFVA